MDKTELLVHRLGLPRTRLGFACLTEALRMVQDDITLLTSMTTKLYPEIAKRVNSSPARVERNLRTAVEICWQYGNRAYLNEVTMFPLTSRPSVGEFIDHLVLYLQMQE